MERYLPAKVTDLGIPEDAFTDVPETFEGWAIWLGERGCETRLSTDLNRFWPLNAEREPEARYRPTFTVELLFTRAWAFEDMTLEVEVQGSGETPLAALKQTIQKIRLGMYRPTYNVRTYYP